MSKLEQHVIRALNIKVGDTPELTKLVHDPYKNSLNNVLDSNIDDIVASTIDINLCPLRQKMLATQPGTFFDVPLPSGLFSGAASGGDKNSSLSAKRNLSPTLPPNIVPRELSNPLFRPFGKYCKLKKGKPKAALMSWGLRDMGYITDQSGSQGASSLSKSNVNDMESS